MVVLTDDKLAVGSSGQDVTVWDVSTKRCVWDWHALSPSYATVFPMVALPNGLFASGSMDSMVRIWDITLLTVKLLRGHRREINALALLPGGVLVSASADTTVLVWDINRAACVRQLTGHSMPVRSLAVIDGDRLAAGSMAHNVCVWHVPTGQCLHHLWGHGGSVRAMAVLFDGTLACATDGFVLVWDPDSGECLHVLRAHPGTGISHLAVLPNGQLVSGGLDCTMRFWI
jgi:WD40 repeat protein